MHIDLGFSVVGSALIPADHGYLLYSALSRQVPVIHAENGIAVHPLRGLITGPRQLSLQPWSHLTLRCDTDRIPDLLKLAGKSLRVGETHLRVGVPQVLSLIPAPALRSRLVTIKHGDDPGRFRRELRRKLDAFAVASDVTVTLGKRRTLRIKDKEVVGYEVLLEGLTAQESLAVQENRPVDRALAWSRTHMGCGVFVPVVTNREVP